MQAMQTSVNSHSVYPTKEMRWVSIANAIYYALNTNAKTSSTCVTAISLQALQRSLKSCNVDSTPEVVRQ